MNIPDAIELFIGKFGYHPEYILNDKLGPITETSDDIPDVIDLTAPGGREQAKKALKKRKKGRTRYPHRRVFYDEHWFDSNAECMQYKDLIMRKNALEIRDLRVHPRFLILPAFEYRGEHIRAIHYKADFFYLEGSQFVVEDVKSEHTAKARDYQLIVKWFKKLYGDIEFREVVR
jgi:hypothetical protein